MSHGFLQRTVGLERAGGLQSYDPPNMRGMWAAQTDVIRALRRHKSFLVATGPGTGKTPMALRALRTRDRAIVVCPASIVTQWGEAVQRWRPDLRPTEGRLRRPDEGEVLIVSWDTLRAHRGPLLVYEAMRDVALIPDELDRAKNDGALRSMAWRRLLKQCGRVWGLTGTPMPRSRKDLWGVLVSCRLDGALGMTWQRFRALEPEDVKERLADVMARWQQEDVLPNATRREYGTVTVTAPPDLRKFLDESRAVSAAWADIDQGKIPPFHLLSEALMALAKSRIDPACGFTHEKSTTRDPILVFSAHVAPVQAIASLPGCDGFYGETPRKEQWAMVKAFQANRLRALAMTIDTGGFGLDLFAAGAILFVDRMTRPDKNEQAERRGARPGQKRPTLTVWRMVSDHPLDVHMQALLDRRQAEITATVG